MECDPPFESNMMIAYHPRDIAVRLSRQLKAGVAEKRAKADAEAQNCVQRTDRPPWRLPL